MVALQEDLAVLDRATDAAFGFEVFAQFLQAAFRAGEAGDEGNLLAFALFAVERYAELLLSGREFLG